MVAEVREVDLVTAVVGGPDDLAGPTPGQTNPVDIANSDLLPLPLTPWSSWLRWLWLLRRWLLLTRVKWWILRISLRLAITLLRIARLRLLLRIARCIRWRHPTRLGSISYLKSELSFEWLGPKPNGARLCIP